MRMFSGFESGPCKRGRLKLHSLQTNLCLSGFRGEGRGKEDYSELLQFWVRCILQPHLFIPGYLFHTLLILFRDFSRLNLQKELHWISQGDRSIDIHPDFQILIFLHLSAFEIIFSPVFFVLVVLFLKKFLLTVI